MLLRPRPLLWSFARRQSFSCCQLLALVRLVECLLDRHRDPAPVVNGVALPPGPLPHCLGLLTGPTTAAGANTRFAGLPAATARLGPPGLINEFSDGLVKLLDIFTREI